MKVKERCGFLRENDYNPIVKLQDEEVYNRNGITGQEKAQRSI